MSTSPDPREAERVVPSRVGRPPAPGAESAGPALAEMVVELARTRQALEQLTREARAEARERYVTAIAADNTDANGDASLELFQVPQGCTGHLLLCCLDAEGVTPAAPITNANLWHGIFAVSGGGSGSAAQVKTVGSMMDCIPSSPAADAQIPFTYLYGDRYSAPTLVGPGAFVVLIDAATASIRVAARYGILLSQPEP